MAKPSITAEQHDALCALYLALGRPEPVRSASEEHFLADWHQRSLELACRSWYGVWPA